MCLGCVSNWLPVLALVTTIVSWPLVMYEACISNGLIHSTNGLATKLCVWQPQQAVAWSAEEQRQTKQKTRPHEKNKREKTS